MMQNEFLIMTQPKRIEDTYTERPQRILNSEWADGSTGGLIRAVVKDFPAFRTASTPNEWEKGYHCVIETLWQIATEFDLLEKEND